MKIINKLTYINYLAGKAMFQIQLIYLVFDGGEEPDIVSLIQHLDKDAS